MRVYLNRYFAYLLLVTSARNHYYSVCRGRNIRTAEISQVPYLSCRATIRCLQVHQDDISHYTPQESSWSCKSRQVDETGLNYLLPQIHVYKIISSTNLMSSTSPSDHSLCIHPVFLTLECTINLCRPEIFILSLESQPSLWRLCNLLPPCLPFKTSTY